MMECKSIARRRQASVFLRDPTFPFLYLSKQG